MLATSAQKGSVAMPVCVARPPPMHVPPRYLVDVEGLFSWEDVSSFIHEWHQKRKQKTNEKANSVIFCPFPQWPRCHFLFVEARKKWHCCSRSSALPPPTEPYSQLEQGRVLVVLVGQFSACCSSTVYTDLSLSLAPSLSLSTIIYKINM